MANLVGARVECVRSFLNHSVLRPGDVGVVVDDRLNGWRWLTVKFWHREFPITMRDIDVDPLPGEA